MSIVDQPANPARALDVLTVVLVAVISTVLVAGYVVLAALGRDTTGYLLFLGGPAVSGIVGMVVNRRVSQVSAAVATTQAETKAVVEDGFSDVDNHLSEQDEVLRAAAASAAAAHRAAAGPVRPVPGPRGPEQDVFGPIEAGIVRRQEQRP